ncbi:hypothetical protein [Actinomadura gamaensis]|uniref:Excreted virulence factor EspC (Type VII ESX diderm) n=1 Tax=Actinomadura gamaensis TaxID=1763541 RepID=A0ABV9UCM9_9ACTN
MSRISDILNTSTPPADTPRAPLSPMDGGRPGDTGGADGEVKHVPEDIKRLGKQVEDDVAKLVKEAAAAIKEAEIGPEDFSDQGFPMGIAYPGAHEYGVTDGESKEKHLGKIAQKLDRTAEHWEKAEEKSTVRGRG